MTALVPTGVLAFLVGDLDADRASSSGSQAVLSHVHDPLLRSDGSADAGTLIALVMSETASEHVLTVAPRRRFHDGSPVTAAAVAETLSQARDGDLGERAEAAAAPDRAHHRARHE